MTNHRAAKQPWHVPKLEEVDYAAAEELPIGTAKRPWHTPTLEEVDFAAAESGAYSGVVADMGVYSRS